MVRGGNLELGVVVKLEKLHEAWDHAGVDHLLDRWVALCGEKPRGRSEHARAPEKPSQGICHEGGVAGVAATNRE